MATIVRWGDAVSLHIILIFWNANEIICIINHNGLLKRSARLNQV